MGLYLLQIDPTLPAPVELALTMKVLLVEDAPGMRKIVGTMLKGMGHDDVVTAETGLDALDILRQARVDLLLTNWNMPGMDGLELVRQVRQMSEYAHLPVLMFTSRASKQDVVKALKVGVDDYVRKPFSPSQLKQHIDEVLGECAERQIDQFLKGLDPLGAGDQHPLMVIGDGARTRQELQRPEHRDVLDFLSTAAASVGRVNSRGGDLHVGLLAYSSSSDMSRYVRSLGSRVKALIVSTRLPGGGLSLARLLSVNKRADLNIFVVCDKKAEIPDSIRLGLARLDITVFERQRLSGQSLEQLVDEQVLAKVHQPRPSELPTPEAIRQRLETDIRLSADLPVMPQVFHQIVTLSRDAESEMQQWIEPIEADPLARAQVIRRARSPIYGFQGDISDTGKAVILLGKSAVKEVIVSKSVQRAFEEVKEESFDLEEYWLHSMAVGLTARLLVFPLDEGMRNAEQQKEWERLELGDDAVAALQKLDLGTRLKPSPHEDPFLGGMMHDIGKVALAHAYPGLYPLIAEELVGKGWAIPMRFAEETFAGGADHTLVGRIMAQGWGLGDEICRVIENHHEPSPGDAFVSLVSVANFVAGGAVPYPQVGQYPLVRILAGNAPATDGDAEDDPRAALELFAPMVVLDELGLSLDDVVELAGLLAPAVRRQSEAFRDKASEHGKNGDGEPPEE